jgi:hypothetical protein
MCKHCGGKLTVVPTLTRSDPWYIWLQCCRCKTPALRRKRISLRLAAMAVTA